MSTPRSTGNLTFSILLESGAPTPADPAHQLLELFTRHRVPATWAMKRPWQNPLTAKLQKAKVPHELALLGDRNWAESPNGRLRATLELSRRIDLARQAGLEITAAVLSGNSQAAVHAAADALAVEQVRAVWQVPAPAKTSPVSRPVLLRDRLWHTPANLAITPTRGWLASARQRGGWRRIFQEVADTAGFVHVWIDASAAGSLSAVESAVASATMAQSSGGLRIAALGALADQLDAAPKAKPSQSILRRAA